MNLSFLKDKLKPFVESNIYLQSCGMLLLRNFPALLPHDSDYYALKHFVTPSEVGLFLDIGANTGLSALSFRKFSKRTPIYSVEPNPNHSGSLSKLKKSDPFFDFAIVAIGENPGSLKLFVPAIGRITLHTMASTSMDDLKRSCDLVVKQRYQRKLLIHEYEVKVTRLDDLGLAPSIIKIDTEGYEEAALLGATETIDKTRPYLMIEHNQSNIQAVTAFLAARRYILLFYVRDKDCFTRHALGSRNVFFVPEEKVHPLPVEKGDHDLPIAEVTTSGSPKSQESS